MRSLVRVVRVVRVVRTSQHLRGPWLTVVLCLPAGGGCAPRQANLPDTLVEAGPVVSARAAGADRFAVGAYVLAMRQLSTEHNPGSSGLIGARPERARQVFDVEVTRDGSVRDRTRCTAEYSWRRDASSPYVHDSQCVLECNGTAGHLSLRTADGRSYEGALRATGGEFRVASVTARGGIVGAVEPGGYVVFAEDRPVYGVDVARYRFVGAPGAEPGLLAATAPLLFFSTSPP